MRVLFNIGHKDNTPQTFALLLSFGFLIKPGVESRNQPKDEFYNLIACVH